MTGPRSVSDAADLVQHFVPGERVFLPGSAGEAPGIIEALYADAAPPLAITASFVPGLNAVSLDRLAEGSTWTGTFPPTSVAGPQDTSRFRALPLSYYGFAGHLARAAFDTVVVHVSRPDANGICWLGPAVEFTPVAIRCSRRVFAVVNDRMPRLAGSATFDVKRAALVLETSAMLREYDVGAPSEQASVIAGHIAAFVEDGSTLQVGLGKVPDALMRALGDRRRLRLHSGMLSDGTRLLAEAGALDPDARHTSCVHIGTAAYYAWLDGRPEFDVRGCDVTHAPATLAALPRLVAVNSAISVDLFGQANLEMLDGRQVSGVGGAADFAHAAAMAVDGLSIVALPATSGRNPVSRIVPQLEGVCSLPRTAIDVVITEHGAADLRSCAIGERAERLIAVADPSFRRELADTWKTMADRF